MKAMVGDSNVHKVVWNTGQNIGLGLQKGGELVPTPSQSQLHGTRLSIQHGF